MSVYTVRLSEWFPVGDDNHETTVWLCTLSRCLACRKRIRFRKAVGHHSLPWGWGDIWCSWKCCRTNKIAKPDKRFERRLSRRLGRWDISECNVEAPDLQTALKRLDNSEEDERDIVNPSVIQYDPNNVQVMLPQEDVK